VLWDEILSDKFVMRGGGQQLDKAAVIKMVAANKCEVKNWKLDDPQIGEIDANTFVLSYKGTFEGSCTSLNGNAMKISGQEGRTEEGRQSHGKVKYHHDKASRRPKHRRYDGGGNKHLGRLDGKGRQEARRHHDNGPFVPKYIRDLFCQQGGHD
jgi:hypothetical protein